MAELCLYLCGTICKRTGTAGIGIVAFTDNKVTLMEKGEYVGQISRNEASYLALIKVLERAVGWKFGPVQVFTDNELMFKQLKGIFDVRDKKLKDLHERVVKLLELNPLVKLKLIERDSNIKAYEMARAAADPEEIREMTVDSLQESPVKWKVIAFTPKLMVVEFVYPKGTVLPLHRHVHEQASYLVKGKLKYTVADKDILLTKGTGIAITGYAEHQIEALTDSKEIVSYYPMRFDLLPPKKPEDVEKELDIQVQTILFG